jgi:Fe-S-cluster-containing hydrogenase component 2
MDVYHQLREQLDQYSVGFPTTPSGVEMKILRMLFTEEEARMYLDLSLTLETPAGVAERTNQDPEVVANLLERMDEKGLIFSSRKNESTRYAAAAFIYGIYEYQEKTMNREQAELFDQYFEEAFLRQNAEHVVPVRSIPINQALDDFRTVAPYDSAREIIKSHDRIAVAVCPCRKQKNLLDEGCEKPLEVCYYFGANGNYFVEKGMARWVNQEEALEIQKQCEEIGLVSQPDNSQRPAVMCHCCGDCCVQLRSIKKYPRPAEMINAVYYAAVDPESCVACANCLERCQMEAITIGPDDVAVVDLDRCIGCGLCLTNCTTEAVTIHKKPEHKLPAEPLAPREALAQRAEIRGKTLQPLFGRARED